MRVSVLAHFMFLAACAACHAPRPPDQAGRASPSPPGAVDRATPPSPSAQPTSRQGEGLYVQRDADILSLAAGGVVIGRVRRGAFVGVDATDGHWATVSLVPFKAKGRIDATALGASRVELSPHDAPTHRLDNRSFRLRLHDGQTVASSCSAPVVWQTDGAEVWITQDAEGIALSGAASLDEDLRCPVRVWRGDGQNVPDGYRRVHANGSRLLLEQSTTFYNLGGDDAAGLACTEWTYRPRTGTPGEGAFGSTTTEPGPEGPITWTLSFRVHLAGSGAAGSRLDLLGPSAVGRDAKGRVTAETTNLCAESFTMVDQDGDGLVVLPNVDASQQAFVAYDPDDARRWYSSRNACERQIDRTRAKGEPRLITLARLASLGC